MAEIVHPTPETEDKSLTAGELQNIHSAYRLNGKNYLKWSQLIRTILKGKGKGSHLTNNAPDEKDAKFKSWDEEDSMIMAWLWNSMIPEISDTCMFLKSAKEIWEAVEQTYSKAKDAAQIYEVKVKTMGAKQGNKSITGYANQLKSLWMELDHYRVIKTRCSEDSAILKEYIEQDRVYDFLVGLNPEYDQVRIQILGKEKVPGLNEVIAIVRSEERRRELMLETPTTENSAMIVEGGTAMVANQKKNRFHNMEKKQEEVWCTYCNKGEVLEITWKTPKQGMEAERRSSKRRGARASTHC
ncbi:gag-polypeptide of LTR copia-type [Sesbania bispinosa]|nr:gag-polypeptide of LTR copia-type [Sesbania bispinosa]